MMIKCVWVMAYFFVEESDGRNVDLSIDAGAFLLRGHGEF